MPCCLARLQEPKHRSSLLTIARVPLLPVAVGVVCQNTSEAARPTCQSFLHSYWGKVICDNYLCRFLTSSTFLTALNDMRKWNLVNSWMRFLHPMRSQWKMFQASRSESQEVRSINPFKPWRPQGGWGLPAVVILKSVLDVAFPTVPCWDVLCSERLTEQQMRKLKWRNKILHNYSLTFKEKRRRLSDKQRLSPVRADVRLKPESLRGFEANTHRFWKIVSQRSLIFCCGWRRSFPVFGSNFQKFRISPAPRRRRRFFF